MMSSRRDMFLALTIASGLHGVALLSIDLPAGGVASGAGGKASISIAAAAPGLRAVVETWETPPEVAEEVILASAPVVETPPKLVGVWDEILITKTPVNRFEMPDVPATVKPPAPPDRALVVANRPPARPASKGGDEAIAGRVARGAGGGVTRGQSQDVAATVAVSPNALRAAQAAWASAIQRRIARYQQFPRSARGTGRVRLSMVIRADGRLTEVQIARSSGKASFDRAAVAAAKKAAPFPAAPKGLSEPWYRVGQWVNFGQ